MYQQITHQPQQVSSSQLRLDHHEQAQLARATSQSYMTAALAQVGQARTGTVGQPVCRLIDMKYTPGEQCMLLYEWGEQLLHGVLDWRSTSHIPAHAIQLPAPLGLWLYDFAHDPALPGLAAMLDPQMLANLVNGYLPPDFTEGAQLVRCRATPLRYRPGKRCTVQLDLWFRRQTTGTYRSARLFGKLYHNPEKARAVYQEMQHLTAATDGAPTLLRLARAVAYIPELAMVLQEPLAGKPLDLMLYHPERWGRYQMARAQHTITQAAQAVAALHRLDVTTERVRPAHADVDKLKRRAANVMTHAPQLGEAMVALGEVLCDRLPGIATAEATPQLGHGDCKPSQFLVGGNHVALLDFDHGGMADPAADVGLFIATLEQARLRAQTTPSVRRRYTFMPSDEQEQWSDKLAQTFLATYAQTAQTPDTFSHRVTWYIALALLRKAQRGFARSPWSPLPAALINAALDALASMPDSAMQKS